MSECRVCDSKVPSNLPRCLEHRLCGSCLKDHDRSHLSLKMVEHTLFEFSPSGVRLKLDTGLSSRDLHKRIVKATRFIEARRAHSLRFFKVIDASHSTLLHYMSVSVDAAIVKRDSV